MAKVQWVPGTWKQLWAQHRQSTSLRAQRREASFERLHSSSQERHNSLPSVLPTPRPSSTLVSCLPIQGHDLFSDENVVLLTLQQPTRWPYWKKGGQNEPSLRESRSLGKVLGQAWPLTFYSSSWTSIRSAGGQNFPVSPYS